MNDSNLMNDSKLEEEKTEERKREQVEEVKTSSYESPSQETDEYKSIYTKTELGSITNNTVNKGVKHKKTFTSGSLIAIVLVVCLVSSSFGAFLGINLYDRNYLTQTDGKDDNQFEQTTTIIKSDSNLFYAAAVNKKNKDAVVGISTTGTQTYETFFGTAEQDYESIGSGFIVSSNGYIVTNSHVIGDGNYKKVNVSLSNGDIEEAKVLWYEPSLDLAIIKIERDNLKFVELGDSDDLIEGEPVAAIGNPLSLKFNGSITDGIISGLNRSITINGKTIKPLIQTNASINPGNSGGPLFNAQGQVIGINTAKMKSAEGLGFSIPINTIKPILAQITNTGEVQNVLIGITGTSVENYESVLGVNLEADKGVVIIEVRGDTPAKAAGLKAGDIITKLGNEEISDMQDIKAALYKFKLGDSTKITLVRDGEEKEVNITFDKEAE